MTLTDILLDGLWAAIAALGFSAVSNPPRIALLFVPLIAALGHMLRYILVDAFALDIAISSFIAALAIGILGVGVGVRLKMPSEVFSFPALLPMIPGLFAYRALLGIIRFMQETVETEKMSFLPDIVSNTITSAMIMFALGVGVSIPLLLFQKKMDYATRLVYRNNE